MASQLTKQAAAIVEAERRLARHLRVRERLLDSFHGAAPTAGAGPSPPRRALDRAAASIRAAELALAEAIGFDERSRESIETRDEANWLTIVGRDAISRLRRSVAGGDAPERQLS